MKKIIITLGLCLLTSMAYAWNFKGHIIIAQMAYEQLTPQAREIADQYANDLYQRLPKRYQTRLNRYQDVSNFARIAVLPDMIRNWKLKTVYHKFDANIPNNLIPFQYKRTASWHFINNAYPANASCHTVKKFNVVWAIDHLETALVQTKQAQARAITMMFLEHYIADSEQPLHTISHVTASCQQDRGGNDYCLRSSNGKCRDSLHKLWDTGVGFMRRRVNFPKKVARLEHLYPKQDFNGLIAQINPLTWTQEDYKYAAFIYSTPEYQNPSGLYYHEGQEIATKQMALAAYRLAYTLNRELG